MTGAGAMRKISKVIEGERGGDRSSRWSRSSQRRWCMSRKAQGQGPTCEGHHNIYDENGNNIDKTIRLLKLFKSCI